MSTPPLGFLNAKKVILNNQPTPSGTVYNTTISTAANGASYPLVLPPANLSGVMINDGSGNLTWQTSSSASLYLGTIINDQLVKVVAHTPTGSQIQSSGLTIDSSGNLTSFVNIQNDPGLDPLFAVQRKNGAGYSPIFKIRTAALVIGPYTSPAGVYLGDATSDLFVSFNGSTPTGMSAVIGFDTSGGRCGALAFSANNTAGTLVYRPIGASPTIALPNLTTLDVSTTGTLSVSGALVLGGSTTLTVGGTLNAGIVVLSGKLTTAAAGIVGPSNAAALFPSGLTASGTTSAVDLTVSGTFTSANTTLTSATIGTL